MIRILHTTDVQIDATLPQFGHLAQQRRNDMLHTFEHSVALAIRENVHLVLVSGNLFATPRPDESAVQRVSTALRRLTARGILPVLLPGDCDGMMTPDSVYLRDTFSNLMVLDGRDPASPQTVRIAGRTVHLYGFCQRGQQPLPPENIRLDEEGCHIALMCFSAPLQIDELFVERVASWEMDYLACAPSPLWQAIESSDRLLGCAPGSPEGFAFSHEGERYVALVQLGSDVMHLERRRVNRKRFETLHLDLHSYLDPGALRAAVNEGARPDLLRRVVLTGAPRFAIDAQRLHAECRDGFSFLEIVDESTVFEGEVLHALAQKKTSRGEFVRQAAQLFSELPEGEKDLVEEAVRAVLACQVRGEERDDEAL